MKLWLLRPRDDLGENPWDPWYDNAFGFVVRADTEGEAREAVVEKAGDEGAAAWRNSELSSCEELTADGSPGIVIRDFASA